MNDFEIKEGMRVRCKYNDTTYVHDRYDQIATVINVHHYGQAFISFTIKWDDGCQLFTSFGNGSYFELYTDSELKGNIPATMISSCAKEAPCSICNKMNDIGVKKCWFCETIIKG